MPENLEAVIEKARRDAFPPLSVVPAFEESEEEKSHRSAIPTEKSTQSSSNTFTGSKNTFDSMTNPHVESSRNSWMEFPPRRELDDVSDDSSQEPPISDGFELSIKYDWAGTGQRDLDTKTLAFGEAVGYRCGGSGTYVKWLVGGSGRTDDTSKDGFERVDVRVNTAKKNGLWTSSCNIGCFAGWFSPSGGTGKAMLEVTYRGKAKKIEISPGEQNGCASAEVATITVYSRRQADGNYFEIS